MIAEGLRESARRLLRLYPERQLLAIPTLAIAGGWVFALAGGTPEEQRRWARAHDAPGVRGRPTSLPRRRCALVARHRGRAVSGRPGSGAPGVRGELSDSSARGRASGDGWRGQTWRGRYYLEGSAERATAMYAELSGTPATSPAGTGRPAWTQREPFHARDARLDAGHWDEAAAHVAEAERLQPAMGLDETIPQRVLGHAALALASAVAQGRSGDDGVRPHDRRLHGRRGTPRASVLSCGTSSSARSRSSKMTSPGRGLVRPRPQDPGRVARRRRLRAPGEGAGGRAGPAGDGGAHHTRRAARPRVVADASHGRPTSPIASTSRRGRSRRICGPSTASSRRGRGQEAVERARASGLVRR